VNTWVPPKEPDEAHTRLNPTCYYVVDMNFKTCLTFKTVTSHSATKQLSGANMAFPRSLDMYQHKHPVDIGGNCGRLNQNQPNGYNPIISMEPRNDFDNAFFPDTTIHIQYDRHGRLHDNQRVNICVDDSLSVCSDGMNDMVGHQSTAIEVDDSNSTNVIVHPHEATI
jgi:hypothetical protein